MGGDPAIVFDGMAERGEIGKQVIGESIRIGFAADIFSYHKGGGIMKKKEPSKDTKTRVSRRKFLAGAAAATAGAAALGVPSLATSAGPLAMRWQRSSASKDIFS